MRGRGEGCPIRFTSLPRQQTYHIACEFLKRCSTIQSVFQLKFKIIIKKKKTKRNKNQKEKGGEKEKQEKNGAEKKD